AFKKRNYYTLMENEILTPAKKYSKTGSLRKFYKSTLQLKDFKDSDKNYNFCIFQERDVIVNYRQYSDLLIVTACDDDVETDEEQLALAQHRVYQNIKQMIREINKNNIKL